MNNFSKLKLLALALNNQALKKLADKQQIKFHTDRALKLAPLYWSKLSLAKFKEQIKNILKTSAEPNSKEFVTAVYEYQVSNSNISAKDGILGEETFGTMIKQNPSLFKGVTIESLKKAKPFSPGPRNSGEKSPKGQLPFDPVGKGTPEIVEFAAEMQFTNLKDIGIAIKNYPFVVPELARMLKTLESQGIKIDRVTEAWPATSNHNDPNHWNGRAIDFTLKNPNQHAQAAAICRSFGFDVVDEYVVKTQYTKGKHLHVDLGSLPSITDRNKFLAWEKRRNKNLQSTV